MALNLYRRHRKECEGSHTEETRTGQFEEGRRGWKKCACMIHVSGTLGGKFSRRKTGTAESRGRIKQLRRGRSRIWELGCSLGCSHGKPAM